LQHFILKTRNRCDIQVSEAEARTDTVKNFKTSYSCYCKYVYILNLNFV